MSCFSPSVSAVEIVHQAAPLFAFLICWLNFFFPHSTLPPAAEEMTTRRREINKVSSHRVTPPFTSPHLCLRTLAFFNLDQHFCLCHVQGLRSPS